MEKNLYELIALNFMERFSFGKDFYSIPNREEILSILQTMKSDSNRYFHTHYNFKNPNRELIEKFKIHEAILYDNFLKELENYIQFDVELQKYGKTFSGTRKRWALINYPIGIYSLTEPLLTKKNNTAPKFEDALKRAKDKTNWLKVSKIIYEKWIKDSKDWEVHDKIYRILLSPENNIKGPEKLLPIYFYFDSAETREKVGKLLKLLKCKKILEEKTSFATKKFLNLIEGSYNFYTAIKINEIKKRLIRNKAILYSNQNYIASQFTQFHLIGEKILSSYYENFKSQNMIVSKNSFKKRVGKNSIVSFNHINRNNGIVLSTDLKNSVEKIIESFPLIFKKESNSKQKSEIGVIKLDRCSVSDPNNILNFEKNEFVNTKYCTFNTKTEKLIFSFGSFLDKTDILNISNVFVNSSADLKLEPGNIVINGPKIDPTVYFAYYLNKEFTQKQHTDKFFEVDSFGLSFNQGNQKIYTGFILQMFYSTFHFNEDNLREMRDIYSSPDLTPKDFYYFITITENKLFKTRSSLVELKNYVNETIFLEFNKEFILNSKAAASNFQGIMITVAIHMIPKFCFDIDSIDKNICVDYLNYQQIAFCVIDNKKYQHELLSERLKKNPANMIIINAMHVDQISDRSTILNGKEYDVGCDFYALEEIDYLFLQSMKSNKSIDKFTKEQLWNINCDDERNILLRLPNKKEFKILENYENEEELISELKNNGLEINDLKKILKNRQYSFLPYVQKLSERREIEEENGNIDYDNAKEMGYETGKWITRVKKFKKYFPAKFLGMTENSNFYYYNYITKEIKVSKINLYNHSEFIKNFKPIQENLFSIYNLCHMDTILLENPVKYSWSIMIKFERNENMEAFMYFLKDLRRKANLSLKNKCLEHEINTKILLSSTDLIKKDMKNLKLILNTIEFRHNFTLSENASVTIKFSKGGVSDNKSNETYILDILQEKNYKSSILEKKEVHNEIELLNNSKIEIKTFIKDHPLIAEQFNTHKHLKFEYDPSNSSKIIDFEVKPNLVKSCFLEITILNSKEKIVLNGEIKIDKIVNNEGISADFYFIPVKLKDSLKISPTLELDPETVVGIVNIGLYTVERLDNHNCTFNNVFQQALIKHTISLRDDYNNYVSFGKYEPNVYKRLMNQIIEKEMKTTVTKIDKAFLSSEEQKSKLVSILDKYSIRGSLELKSDSKSELWKELVVDLDLYNYKKKKKFYNNKKRNEFYREFSISEFKQYLTKIRSDVLLQKTSINSSNDIYMDFPGRKNLIKYKKEVPQNFGKVRTLIYMGIPKEGRLTVWEKIMDIQNLVNITIERLKKEANPENEYNKEFFDEMSNMSFEKQKIALYVFYNNQIENNFTSHFSLIDNDLNFLKIFTEFKNSSEERKILKTLKDVAKAFFIWSKLGIVTDNITLFSSEKKKFVYFLGLLQLIQRLDSVFVDDYKTFWIICGLSQYIEMFYQINPLYQNQMSFSKIYVFITKLILENNLPELYNKFIELNFPIEIFLSQSVSTIYSDYFQTDLFLRIMDIIIFEASLETDNNDKVYIILIEYDYLRLLCTIPLTLLKLNEKKILAAKNVMELDKLFSDLIIKTYKVEKFIQHIRVNIDEFYKTQSLMDRFINYRTTNTSWDHKRDKVTKLVQQYFIKVEEENNMFLQKINTNNINSGLLISNLEDQIVKSISSVRNLYSTNTSKSENNYTVIFIVTGVYDMFDGNNESEKFLLQFEFSSNKKLTDSFNYSNKNKFTELECSNGVVKNPKFTQVESDKIEKYLKFSIFNEKKYLFGNYSLQVDKLDYMKPHRIRLESTDADKSKKKSFLDLGIFKIYSNQLVKQDYDLFKIVFSKPIYLFDKSLFLLMTNNEITEVELNTLSKEISSKSDKFKDNSKLDDHLKSEYEQNFKSNPFNIKMFGDFERLKQHLNFYDNDLLISWLKNNISSFEEILVSLVLIDESCITIYEKLKLIYDIAKMKNFFLFNLDTISIDHLKEIVYSLYKRFMIYFTKVEVDRMVDFIIKKENLYNLRYAFVYNDKFETEIIEIIQDKKSNNTNFPNNGYLDLTKYLSDKTNLIENVFNLKKLPDYLISLILKMNKNLNRNYNRFIIHYDNENIRKTRIYEHDMGSLKPIKSDSLLDINEANTVYKMLLKEEMENIELVNNQNEQLEFEKFKEVIFKLPFISDLFRCTMSFSEFRSQTLIKVLPSVRVKIPTSDYTHYKVFIFSGASIANNSKSVILYHMKDKLIDTSNSIQDIIELIVSHLSDSGLSNAQDEIKLFLDQRKLITFVVKVNNLDIEERIKFNDPFYSLNSIRNIKDILNVDIEFKMERSLDITFVNNNKDPIYLKKGLAKFVNYDKKYFEWRDCRIKESDNEKLNKKKITFTCFENKTEYEMDTNEVIFDRKN